jgi:hypothetical protein
VSTVPESNKMYSLCSLPTGSTLTDMQHTWRCCLCLSAPLSFFVCFYTAFQNLLIHTVRTILGSFPSNKRNIIFKCVTKITLLKAFTALYIYDLFVNAVSSSDWVSW